MIGNKTLVLMVAMMCIGMFVLPQALALYTGMHQYVPIDYTDCAKCHPAEAAELLASPYHWYGAGGNITQATTTVNWGTTINDACVACHQVKGQFDNASQHPAVIIPCIACHGNVADELNHTSEAHRNFWMNATTDDEKYDANEACIACHTMVGFNYTPTLPTNLTYDATTGEFGTRLR